jgi:hypothetical protein
LPSCRCISTGSLLSVGAVVSPQPLSSAGLDRVSLGETRPAALPVHKDTPALIPSRPPRLAWVSGVLRYRPFLLLLCAAVALRAATLALYFPGVVLHPDAMSFARVAPGMSGIFDAYLHPALYPIFLRSLRLVSDQIWFTIAGQHLLGLLAGTALYLGVTRLGVPRWLGLIPAGVYLLSGDVLFLEHVLLSDQLALALTLLALSAAIFGLRPKVDARWLAAAGALASSAWLARISFVAVVVVVVAAAMLAVSGRRTRAIAAGAAAVGAASVFGLYLLAFQVSGGRYLGLWDMTGWNLAARVAPFAQCDRFDVPDGAQVLCESTPPADRPGSFFYTAGFTSPAVRAFHQTPQEDGLLYDFAVRAIRAQPADYANIVISDFARYIRNPSPPARPLSGHGTETWAFDNRPASVEEFVGHQLAAVYNGTEVSAPGQNLLGDYQKVMRVPGLLIAVLLLLTPVGAIWGRGPGRLGAALFGSTSYLLFIGPVATITYDFRYGFPPTILLTCAGTLAGYALWVRIDQRRLRSAASSSSTHVATRPE